jgi:hypothetical protein
LIGKMISRESGRPGLLLRDNRQIRGLRERSARPRRIRDSQSSIGFFEFPFRLPNGFHTNSLVCLYCLHGRGAFPQRPSRSGRPVLVEEVVAKFESTEAYVAKHRKPGSVSTSSCRFSRDGIADSVRSELIQAYRHRNFRFRVRASRIVPLSRPRNKELTNRAGPGRLSPEKRDVAVAQFCLFGFFGLARRTRRSFAVISRLNTP